MSEKEKKKKKRLIIRIVLAVIALVIVIWVVLLIIPKKEVGVSEYLQSLQGQLQADPDNEELQKDFVREVIREQERIYDFTKKTKSVILEARDLARTIVEKEDDYYIALILARLDMQLSGIANEKADIVNATFGVRDAIVVFDRLLVDYPDNLLVRMYRALNYSSIPNLFGKKDEAVVDFNFVADIVLADAFDVNEEFEDYYFQGLTQACLEAGVLFFDQEKIASERMLEAQLKIESQLE